MSTKNVVPRTTHQGQLGRVDKVWSAIHVDDVYADNVEAEGEISSATISATGSASVGSLTSAGNVQATGSVSGASGSFTGSVSAGSISSSGSITGSTLTLTSNTADTLFWLIRKATTQYQVGDIAYSPNLPSWARLECVQAGTTSIEEPDWSEVTTGGVYVTDGTCRWIVDDVRDGRPTGSLSLDYHVRAGYLVADGRTLNRADYPRLWKWAQDNSLTTSNTAGFLGLFGTGDGSTTFVLPNYDGRWIAAETEGGTTLGATIDAGLPNITGGGNYDKPELYMSYAWAGWFNGTTTQKRGALSVYMPSNNAGTLQASGSSTIGGVSLAFDASKSNPIYGNSTTVRPNSISLLPLIKY